MYNYVPHIKKTAGLKSGKNAVKKSEEEKVSEEKRSVKFCRRKVDEEDEVVDEKNWVYQ